jgi:N-acyl-D-amino-acid deacylase
MSRMERVLAPFFLAVAALLAAGSVQPPRFDVVTRHARVMDGSGNPWMRADLGTSGDRITAVGRLDAATAARVIDARDRVVAPGLIDVHSQPLDGLVLPDLHQGRPLIAQGVTTLVGNPDGGGPVDLAAQRAAIEAARRGPNVALLIGHGSVRRAVLADARREPTVAELERMKELSAS